MCEEYLSKRAVLGLNLCIDFEEDRVRLDIPMEGMVIKDGWKLTPLFFPTVSITNNYVVGCFKNIASVCIGH